MPPQKNWLAVVCLALAMSAGLPKGVQSAYDQDGQLVVTAARP